MPIREPIFIAGPTGVGKSAVAVRLAQLLRGEIISADSMQVYQGLDIGTAKPSKADQALIRHHLIDVATLDEPFDASRFVQLARQAVLEIQNRGSVPIFCGGTGLYFKAYLEGIGEAPTDAALRAELEAKPLPDLLKELAQADPELFGKIDRANRRRVVRAVEVIRLTGRPFSEQRANWSAAPKTGSISGVHSTGLQDRFFCLHRSPEDLRDRIDRRVDVMFALGLVAETERLLARGLTQNRTAMQAIGYRQVVQYLRGERSLLETNALIKQKTRQFAKRQMTWFRHQLPVHWLEALPGTTDLDLAQRIEASAAGGEA